MVLCFQTNASSGLSSVSGWLAVIPSAQQPLYRLCMSINPLSPLQLILSARRAFTSEPRLYLKLVAKYRPLWSGFILNAKCFLIGVPNWWVSSCFKVTALWSVSQLLEKSSKWHFIKCHLPDHIDEVIWHLSPENRGITSVKNCVLYKSLDLQLEMPFPK